MSNPYTSNNPYNSNNLNQGDIEKAAQLQGQQSNQYQSQFNSTNNLMQSKVVGQPFSEENMAVLRKSARYIPKENIDSFAQFLQLQVQQGNTHPSQMLKSAVQISQEQQRAEQLQLANQPNQYEAAIMKRMDFSKSNHPTACFFHLIFKALALATHLVLSFFMDSLKIHYLTILFCAMDFWVVKNITGRLLIGLRWWSECQEDNSTKWVFECKINKSDVNDFNFNVFWSLQIIASLLWATLLVINVIGFDIGDSAVCTFAVFSTFWNTYYFYKCNTKQKDGLKRLAGELQSDIPLNFMHGSVRFPL